MEVEKVLSMNGGVGQSSYANNSNMQRTVMMKSKPILEESIEEVCHGLKPKCFMMAEMGCSSGPNALHVVSEIINIVDKACRSLNLRAPEFGVFLNDLPGNDFNTLFSFLPDFHKWVEEEKGSDFGPCFVSGTPNSFHGRVFPNQFLHFVHSCYSLHWLSQVPKELVSEEGEAMNKGNIYIAKTSPPEVYKAYYTQFERDFMVFLRSRASEVVAQGRMVFTFLGSFQSDKPDPGYELLGSTLRDMVLEGIITQEKLDNFNLPFYTPTAEEVKQLVEAEGSFVLNNLQTFTLDWSVDRTRNLDDRAKLIAMTIRAAFESLFANAFGEALMDDLFLRRFQKKVQEHIGRETSESLNIIVSMTRRA